MAYEVESISPTATPTDTSVHSSPVMREERVVEPYRQRGPRITTIPAENGQQNTIDANVTATTEESGSRPAEETVTLSPQMAALARKEQAFRRQQQEFKAQLAAAQAQQTELTELRTMKAKLEAKDFSDIEKIVPYNDYATWLIENGGKTTPEQQALKKLESELEGVKEAQKNDVEKRFEAAVAERRSAVNALVESSAEFKGIKKLKQQEAVVQHILDTWEHDDVELTVEQASKEVEQALTEKAKQWASIIDFQESSTPADKKELPPLKTGSKTLTNEMTIQGEEKSTRKSFQGMTDSQRYAEARRRAEEKLKQGIR